MIPLPLFTLDGKPLTTQRQNRVYQVLAKKQHDLTVLLENVFDPHNISAIMRTCDAIGVVELYVLNTDIKPHPRFGKRSSRSANTWMMVHQFTDREACLKAIRSKYSRMIAACIEHEPVNLYETDLTLPTALVFGNEQRGITAQTLAQCDGYFSIPQQGMIASLNVSVACAVSLYEAYRQKSNAGHYSEQRIPKQVEIELLNYWHLKTGEISVIQ